MPMESLKLTRSELGCLRALAEPGNARVSALGNAIGASPPQVSRVVSALIEKGFIATEKVGLSKIVVLTEAKHAVLWRKLVAEFGHMPLDELLSGASLEVLSAISYLKLKNRQEVAQQARVSETSTAKVLQKLKQVGVVQKVESTYTLSSRFQTLKEFVTEFRHYLNQKTARTFADDAIVVWGCNSEFIVESTTREERDGFQLTGISSFARYGIPMLVTKSHFFHSPFVRKLRLEDVILHSLLVTDQMLPVLLVWRKQERTLNRKYLQSLGEKYGVRQRVDQIITYFGTQGREGAPGFPPWNEFTARAQEYGIV